MIPIIIDEPKKVSPILPCGEDTLANVLAPIITNKAKIISNIIRPLNNLFKENAIFFLLNIDRNYIFIFLDNHVHKQQQLGVQRSILLDFYK